MFRLSLFAAVLVAWVFLSVLTGLLLLPGAATLLIYVTCGVGVIFFVIPTLWLYLTSALPGLTLTVVKAPWWAAVLTALLGVALTASALPFLSRTFAATEVRRLTADDHDSELPTRPREVRLVERGLARDDRLLQDLACSEACQLLLYGDEVDAVEVRRVDRDGQVASVVWRREERTGCPVAFHRASDALPAVARAIATGDCLVHTPGETLPEAPWVRLERADYRELKEVNVARTLHRVRRLTRVTAGLGSTPLDSPRLHQTRIVSEVLGAPPVFVPSSGNPTNMSLELWRQPRADVGIEQTDALRDVFGYALDDLGAPAPPDLDLLATLLDQTGDQRFGPEQQQTFREVLSPLSRRKEPFDADEIALFERMLRDPRVVELYFLGDLLERHAEVQEPLAEATIARLLMPIDESEGHTRSHLGFALYHLPPRLVIPHAAALRDAIDGEWSTATLLPITGLTGAEGTEVLDAALASDHGLRRRGALAGWCNTPTEVASGRLDDLQARLDADLDHASAGLILRALRRHGRGDAADAFLASQDERARRQLKAQVTRHAWDGVPGGCRL